MVLSFFEVLRVPAPDASHFLSLIASGLTAVVLYRFAHSLRFTRVAFLPALLYILWPLSIVADTSGLEIAFFELLVMTAFYYQHKQKPFYSIALATLATLTRPEGLLLLIILVGYNLWREPHRRLQLLGVPVLLLIPWVLFSAVYFGNVIPNSLIAGATMEGLSGQSLFLGHLCSILLLTNPVGWVLLLGLGLGFYWLRKKQNTGHLELAWLALSVIALALIPDNRTSLLASQIFPLYLLLASASIPLLLDRVHLSLETAQKIIFAAAITLSLVLIVGCIVEVREYGDRQDRLREVNRTVGDYLYGHADRDTDWAAVERAGYIGYFSRLKIIDRDGGVSPQALPYIRSGDNFGLIRDYQPQWVGLVPGSPVSNFPVDSLLDAGYVLDRTFIFQGKPAYLLYVHQAK
jgi:hypothetical protein